jgi:hypothetical protein
MYTRHAAIEGARGDSLLVSQQGVEHLDRAADHDTWNPIIFLVEIYNRWVKRDDQRKIG